MSEHGLNSFGAYQKANQLFDLVVRDMSELKREPLCYRLISQQVASADSISSNIEEGYGRLSRPEYIRFLDFARGSARETRGRYLRMKHWLNEEAVQQRVALADEIIAILTKTIHTLQVQLQQSTRNVSYIRDEPLRTSIYDDQFPSDTIPPTGSDV
jgi:four helix bundle protein